MNETQTNGATGSASRARGRRSLERFIEARLGRGSSIQARNWLRGTFGAATFTEFWRTWNPVYGYFLYYDCYRPLRRVLPRAPAVFLTFVACGFFLHDLVGWILGRAVRFPVMTIAFALFALVMIAAEATGLTLARWPLPARAIVNVGYVAACILVATHIPH